MGFLGKVFGNNKVEANESEKNYVKNRRESNATISSKDENEITDNKVVEFEETAISADDSSETDHIKTSSGAKENPFLDPNFATYYRDVYERT
ncbi:hypothetical protein B5S28_g3032 [[Candida] boidinii]|uniref:Unnamed protein product n=1 Tax=Candida boidinii TaxID=5477 RepID=A0ACB5TX69_CANBO|nr:hypothetical protein B5S28_g3032 [[Candida] boidinii]GME96613.1 unnamed protein product [[Candida] boidinii]